MAENTKIEWTDHTFNPWEGCQKVGPGCDNCYAETRNARYAGGQAINWGPGAPRRRTSASNWNKPLMWNKNADAFMAEHGRRQRVFCASLADVFDNAVDLSWREDLFQLIAATPNLDWLLLTKRIGNVPAMVAIIPGWMPPNVWLGATITNQTEAERDIPKLLELPARVRFLSMEPLLGPVNLVPYLYDIHLDNGEKAIDWVIVGGESGSGARPMHPSWAQGLRDQCEAAGVPFLFKQWGEWGPAHAHLGFAGAPPDPAGESSIAGTEIVTGKYQDGRLHKELWPVVRAGKKANGRMLDGRTWDGFPQL
jgi:protein gp37